MQFILIPRAIYVLVLFKQIYTYSAIVSQYLLPVGQAVTVILCTLVGLGREEEHRIVELMHRPVPENWATWKCNLESESNLKWGVGLVVIMIHEWFGCESVFSFLFFKVGIESDWKMVEQSSHTPPTLFPVSHAMRCPFLKPKFYLNSSPPSLQIDWHVCTDIYVASVRLYVNWCVYAFWIIYIYIYVPYVRTWGWNYWSSCMYICLVPQ